jgi:CHAT domain-containing protein
MEALYRARFAGMSTADALREAALERLASLRALDRSDHPFHWGAFVGVGGWQ